MSPAPSSVIDARAQALQQVKDMQLDLTAICADYPGNQLVTVGAGKFHHWLAAVNALLASAVPAPLLEYCQTCGHYKDTTGDTVRAEAVPAPPLQVVVNGQPVEVMPGPIRSVIEQAITKANQIGAPIEQWVLRTREGDIIPHDSTSQDWELVGGHLLFLHLGLPVAVPAPPEKECRKCHQVEAAHCDFDEPGLDHAETCMKLHHQFVAITRGDQSDPSFFRTLEKWLRVDDPDGGEIIVIQFAEGGTVNVLTEKPLLFIEPERH